MLPGYGSDDEFDPYLSPIYLYEVGGHQICSSVTMIDLACAYRDWRAVVEPVAL
jgi:hypothetical protein